MKIYISGKISELPDYEVKEKFEQAEALIRSLGHEPVSPVKNGLLPSSPWKEHMVADIRLLFGCKAIYMLPDWMESRGARIEYKIAEEIGMNIIYH